MGRKVFGQITLEITCADCAGLLNSINTWQIYAKNIVYQSDLVICITVSGRDYFRIRQLVNKQGGTIVIKRLSVVHKYLRNVKKHPVILSALALLILMTIYVPKWVLFISVEGNVSVPTKRVLEASEHCGLHFGASRKAVRSEVIKNNLLAEIPELQWAGVNTRGCTAIISVREKTTQERKEQQNKQVSSIVAIRDGIVQNCTVYQGTSLCVPGQVVKSGQTLVSGYTDCGLTVKATRAEAEITALTFRDLQIVTPNATNTRGKTVSQKTQYALRIGKKLINLSKDSGNFDTSCVKIYSEKSVGFPGGFNLPVSLVKITSIYYDTAEQAAGALDQTQWLEDFSVSYLKKTMIAGNVISSQSDFVSGDGYVGLRGRFACLEMIGQTKYEQTLLKD